MTIGIILLIMAYILLGHNLYINLNNYMYLDDVDKENIDFNEIKKLNAYKHSLWDDIIDIGLIILCVIEIVFNGVEGEFIMASSFIPPLVIITLSFIFKKKARYKIYRLIEEEE